MNLLSKELVLSVPTTANFEFQTLDYMLTFITFDRDKTAESQFKVTYHSNRNRCIAHIVLVQDELPMLALIVIVQVTLAQLDDEAAADNDRATTWRFCRRQHY